MPFSNFSLLSVFRRNIFHAPPSSTFHSWRLLSADCLSEIRAVIRECLRSISRRRGKRFSESEIFSKCLGPSNGKKKCRGKIYSRELLAPGEEETSARDPKTPICQLPAVVVLVPVQSRFLPPPPSRSPIRSPRRV